MIYADEVKPFANGCNFSAYPFTRKQSLCRSSPTGNVEMKGDETAALAFLPSALKQSYFYIIFLLNAPAAPII